MENIYILSYYHNNILRVYYKCIYSSVADDTAVVDENGLYLEIFNYCKHNRQLLEDKHLSENKNIQIFKYNKGNLIEDDKGEEYFFHIWKKISGILKFDMPIYFNYGNMSNDENVLFSQITLQNISLCNDDQMDKFNKIVKLIMDCKQFINFEENKDIKFKFVILYATEVIGYIEHINAKIPKDQIIDAIQCFILPKYRKNGIAHFAHKMLFSIEAATYIQDEGIKYKALILPNNISAINLYTNLKFTLSDEKYLINELEYDVYEYLLLNKLISKNILQEKSPLEELNTWNIHLKNNFPYRKYYIPSFEIMYNNLIKFKDKKCVFNGINSTIINGQNKYLAIIDRTFPDDYNNADSIVDHFVEDIRIHCAERNEKTPYAIWEENKNKFLEEANDVYKLRELVYNGARGCNIFNVSLGIYLFSHFKATSLLDCTAGWGDRLIAASIAGVKFYRGWDTNEKLQSKYDQIYNKIYETEHSKLVSMDWKIFCAPFEKTKLFNKDECDEQNLYKKFDVAFLSPPFYDKELYEGELTSTKTYKNIDDWYSHFYRPMFKRAAMAVKPGGHILGYIPDGRMRKEANSVLRDNGFEYLGSVAFRTIVVNKKPQIRDTFVWRSLLEKGFTQNGLLENTSIAAQNDLLENTSIEAQNDLLEKDTYIDQNIKSLKSSLSEGALDKIPFFKSLICIKKVSEVKFKLGQHFSVFGNPNNKITSEEKFKSLDPNLEIIEIPKSIKKTIIINLLTYKILINGIIIYKYYISKDVENAQKIITLDKYPIKIINHIRAIIKQIPNIELSQNMSMIKCIFSIDNEDVCWVTNIYENTNYVCPLHKDMVLNKIIPYKCEIINANMGSKDSKLDSALMKIKIKENIIEGTKHTFSILYNYKSELELKSKNIGILSIEKNHYGFEVYIYIGPKYKKKDILLIIFICICEYIPLYVKTNDLVYIEVPSEDKDYLQICKKIGLKDITTYGHTSSKIYKFYNN